MSGKLHQAVLEFTKRWTVLAVAISAPAILATGLICYFVIGSERDELDTLGKDATGSRAR